jgi:hypothetical protein
MSTRTPAQLYALSFGAVLVLAGIIGFAYEASFSADESVRDAVFGLLDVNGWHNLVHIASGVAGLALMGSAAGARLYALGLGAVYVVVAVWGFAVGDGGSILSIIPVNTEDNVLHSLIGILGLAAGAASTSAGAVRTPAPAR